MIAVREKLFSGAIVATAVFLARGTWGAGAAATQDGASGLSTTAQAQDSRTQYWFGVAVEHLPPTIAKQLKLKSDQGLMVVAVLPNTPAEKAGLKAEDLLIEIDGNPLTSQEDLARAANTPRTYKLSSETSVQTPLIKKSSVTYLREGDRKTVNIMPSVRPENMVVVGNSVNTFTLQTARVNRGQNSAAQQAGVNAMNNGDAKVVDEVRNIVLPDGTAAQVGPGYQFELNGADSATQTVRSIKQIVGRGQTVVLSQENDGKGNLRNTIVVGGKSYAVEHGKLDTIPVDVRPLAQQLLVNMPVAPAGVGGVTAAEPAPAGGLEQRVNDLEKQNQGLQMQLKELIDLLKEKKGG